MQVNEIKHKKRNAIIRLVCINRCSRFKYRKGSESKGGAGMGTGVWGEEQVPEFGGRSDHKDMRLSQHMIREHEG